MRTFKVDRQGVIIVRGWFSLKAFRADGFHFGFGWRGLSFSASYVTPKTRKTWEDKGWR